MQPRARSTDERCQSRKVCFSWAAGRLLRAGVLIMLSHLRGVWQLAQKGCSRLERAGWRARDLIARLASRDHGMELRRIHRSDLVCCDFDRSRSRSTSRSRGRTLCKKVSRLTGACTRCVRSQCMIVGGFSIYQYHTFTSYQQLCSVRSLKKSIYWVFTSTPT